MDPTQALIEILLGCRAIGRTNDPAVREETADILFELAAWLERGGFVPDVDRAIDEYKVRV